MSFETRMEQLDADITVLENAPPFVITQNYPPNQIHWEDAWVAAGNSLPIPTVQELYWRDDFTLRGEYKTLPDQFSLLSRSQSTGFQIRDIAGWEDDDHLIVYVVRDDNATGTPSGTCRLFMDGTLEQITLTGFTPTGLLGYDRTNSLLWYVDSSFRIRYINVNTLTITTVATAASAANLPEWRFFVLLGDGSGDAYYGARLGADPARRLYFYDRSALSNTMVLATFNYGSGSVAADRPVAVTTNYVFLSSIHTRAAFDGNRIYQINRTGHTYQTQVDHGTYSNEVRVLVNKTNYVANTIEVVVGHVLGAVLLSTWNRTVLWNAAIQTSTFSANQPHNIMLKTLRQNLNDHGLSYHMDTRLYYDPAFIADGGNEAHYNNIGAMLLNPTGDKYLIHDLGWHTWTVSDAPDIYLFADSTHKIYRISDWGQFDDDIIILYKDVFPTDYGVIIPIANLPADYGLIEVIHEVPTDVAGLLSTYLNTPQGGGFHSSNTQVLAHVDGATPTLLNLAGEITTSAHIRHYFMPRYKLSSDYEIQNIFRHSVRTASAAHVHIYTEGMYLKNNETELTEITISIDSSVSGILSFQTLVRAWRTAPRVKSNGSEYDPSMA